MLDDLDLAWDEQQNPSRARHGGPPNRQVRQRRRKEKKRRRRSFGALLISFLLLAVLGGGVYWGVGKAQEFFGTPDYDQNPATTPATVTVKPGDSATQIGSELQDKLVVKSAKAFIAAAAADPKSKTIQPGTYKLWEQMPASAALAMLLDPDKNMVVNKVTIREGLTAIQTYKELSKATGIAEQEFVEAAKDPIKNLKIPDYYFTREDGKTAEISVEGFLFPDTYRLDPGLTAKQILQQMVDQFLTVAGELKFAENAQTIGLAPFEVLIVASLAQVEAGKEEDMGKVARVAYNRAVKDGFACKCLQFDVTVNYWLEKQGKPTKASKDMTAAELDDAANPWNTGPKSEGLPVGPISNPGRAALQGAMSPPAATWLYFVAVDKQGTTKFATTPAEHAKNEAEARANGVL